MTHLRAAVLSPLRQPRVALPLLILAPLPIAVALVVTGRPEYPDDACYYGAPQASLLATDDYLALMTPLAMVPLAIVAVVGLPIRGRWGLIAPVVAAWAAAALVWTDAARPIMTVGAYIVVFGLFLAVPILVLVGVAGRESSWVRAIGWFELLYLLPALLGLAGVLAQPACFNGDPPAPIAR